MGIPIKLHITFLIILPIFVLVFANSPAPFGFSVVESITLRYVFGGLAAVSLFGCVILHELGHSYVALKNGVRIKNITLMLFGGVASMEEIPRNPKIELKMAMAGPGVSLMLAVIFTLLYSLVRPVVGGDSPISILLHLFVSLMLAVIFALLYLLVSPVLGGDSPISILLYLLGALNVVLGIFNLIPAFPMDGGRLLRAYLATRMSYINATRNAVYVGKMFAFAMGIFGLMMLHPFLILIAFFVYIGASEEGEATEIATTLDDVKVSDVMTRNVISVPPTMTVSKLVDLMFKEKHMGYPVVDEAWKSVKGIVTFSDVQKIPRERRDITSVEEIMTRDVLSIVPDDDAFTALKTMSQREVGRLLVMENGAIVGIVSRTDLIKSIRLLRENKKRI